MWGSDADYRRDACQYRDMQEKIQKVVESHSAAFSLFDKGKGKKK